MGLAIWYCSAEFITCSGKVAPTPAPEPPAPPCPFAAPPSLLAPGMPLTWKMRIESIFSIGRTACSRMLGSCCSSIVRTCRSICAADRVFSASLIARRPSASASAAACLAWASMVSASARSSAASFSADADTRTAMASCSASLEASISWMFFSRSATATCRAVFTSSSALTASARAMLAAASASDCSRDFVAIAICVSWRAISTCLRCSARCISVLRSSSISRVCTTRFFSISADLISRSASMRFWLTWRSASIFAASAWRVRSACCDAINATCSARVISISRCCDSVANSWSFSMLSFCRVASRFLVRTCTSVSCSTSLRCLRRASVCSVSRVRPSASKALFGLKNCLSVWSRLVSDTDSSSRPFFSRSSATAFCTAWTKSRRLSCSSWMDIVAAVARSESTNLSSTSALSSSGLMVRAPSVCAAMLTASSVCLTRTKKAAVTSTRMRSRVIRLSRSRRCTSSLSVFMLTSTRSWNTGSTIAPPSMMTFWPPRPVRTKAVSFVERLYRRAKTKPMVSSATRAMPAMVSSSIRLLMDWLLPQETWNPCWYGNRRRRHDAPSVAPRYIKVGCGLAMQR